MLFTNKIYVALMALLLASLACSAPDFFAPDPNAVNTSVAQTVAAMMTQSTQQVTFPPTLEATVTSTATFMPEQPTALQTLTASFTTTPSFTPTLAISLISVSVDTNCRSGPGKLYDLEGALVVGEVAEVFARDPANNYWYIRNPDVDPEFCWIWGKYATLIGSAILLPAFTPPPTPTATLTPEPAPDFTAEYAGLDTCNGSWWMEIKLKNTGSVPLMSVELRVRDKITDAEHVDIADGFINLDGCLKKSTKDILKQGDTYLLSAPPFLYNPTGHKLIVTMTLCSETGQQGMCITKKFDITP